MWICRLGAAAYRPDPAGNFPGRLNRFDIGGQCLFCKTAVFQDIINGGGITLFETLCKVVTHVNLPRGFIAFG